MFKRKLLFFLAKVVIDANIIFGKLVKISSVTTLFIFDFNITLMCRNRIRPKTKFKKKAKCEVVLRHSGLKKLLEC